MNVTKEMEHLHKLAKKHPEKRFTKLWELLTEDTWLMHAWTQIRSNTGSNTPGVDGITKPDITVDRIRHLASALKTGTYTPTVVKRVYIPKSNGKRRPLGISTLDDRIVQQALRMVLEPIFEADFLPCSHGFRPKHSPHTALRDVARIYPRVTWVIEGDIEGCYDNIPHGKLMGAIERRIADGKILHLIKAFLKTGYLEWRRYHATYSGTPQGAIVSPLLCNAYLHQLDQFFEQQGANRVQTRKELHRRRSAAYHRIDNRTQKTRKAIKKCGSKARRRELVQRLKQQRALLRKTPRFDAPHATKLGYVRYADDFAIFVSGTREEAERMKEETTAYLATLGLQLSKEKTLITHWSKAISFLGFDIKGVIRRKGQQIRPILLIPRKKMRQVTDVIKQVLGYYHIPELDAILTVNAKLRGFMNYYRYATSPSGDFGKLCWITWWLFAHFKARKRKVSSIRKLIIHDLASGELKVHTKRDRERRTFTMAVGGKEYVLDLFAPQRQSIQGVQTGEWTVDLKPATFLRWQEGRSAATRFEALNRSNGTCEECGANPADTVHHPRRMYRRSYEARIASDAAQQGKAVCTPCHKQLHHGNWRR
jgi:group II intron reverse transcriptase/maturase